MKKTREVYACASRSGALFVGLTSKVLEITRDEGKKNGGIRQFDWDPNMTFYIHASLYLKRPVRKVSKSKLVRGGCGNGGKVIKRFGGRES